MSGGLLHILKRWGVSILVITGVVFLLLIIHRKVYACYSVQDTYQINLAPLEVLNKPDWCPDSYFEQTIRTSIQMKGKFSLFDKKLFNYLLEQYNANPWIARVESIEKQFPDNLIVKLEIRRPLAVVEIKKWNNRNFYYLVDHEAVRLPGEYYTIPSLSMPLPIIVGVKNSPPLPGEKWHDPGLSNALSVAGVLKQYQVYARLDISSIDITNIGGRINKKESEIVLFTKNKTRIEWGRSADSNNLFEPSSAEKIKNLYQVLEVSAQLSGIKCVKIQFEQPYIILAPAKSAISSPKTNK
jgi:hypothetical protein